MGAAFDLKLANKQQIEQCIHMLDEDFEEGIDFFHELPSSNALYRDPYTSLALLTQEDLGLWTDQLEPDLRHNLTTFTSATLESAFTDGTQYRDAFDLSHIDVVTVLGEQQLHLLRQCFNAIDWDALKAVYTSPNRIPFESFQKYLTEWNQVLVEALESGSYLVVQCTT